jgi:hypothetical protein
MIVHEKIGDLTISDSISLFITICYNKHLVKTIEEGEFFKSWGLKQANCPLMKNYVGWALWESLKIQKRCLSLRALRQALGRLREAISRF